jgi:hypothetical protein
MRCFCRSDMESAALRNICFRSFPYRIKRFHGPNGPQPLSFLFMNIRITNELRLLTFFQGATLGSAVLPGIRNATFLSEISSDVRRVACIGDHQTNVNNGSKHER